MEPEWEAEPAAGFAIEDTMKKFEVTQAKEAVEQTAILESIQQRPRWRSTGASLRLQRMEIDEIFTSSESHDEPKLPQAAIYPKPDTEVVDISMMSSVG